ncbi:hypothetical protein EVAR_43255_1 [Eumeta japonica]|uniref:Uncharacterized protein n=1 Tax=Eumeta variegata TaxID=151549 RepID=A0A4C1WTP3_EUMVA|nr:hypothetical protein EVAR_43255_1 [Eumeta japonica]
MADSLSTENNTGHASLRFIQSNLQLSKLVTSELLIEADRGKISVALVQEPYMGNISKLRQYSGCRVIQRIVLRIGPIKTVIIILNSDVDVEED